MTTLNTIIEEEKKKFFDSLDRTAHRILYDKMTAKQADELDNKAFTTAMQRAYEAGRQSVLDEWKEEQRKFREGFAYRSPTKTDKTTEI